MPTLHSSVLQDELAYASETLIDDDTTLNVVVMHTTIDDLYIYIYIYIHMLQSKGTTMKKNEKKREQSKQQHKHVIAVLLHTMSFLIQAR